jgi:hypothetical protein
VNGLADLLAFNITVYAYICWVPGGSPGLTRALSPDGVRSLTPKHRRRTLGSHVGRLVHL